MLKYAADLRMPDDATDSEKKNRIKTVLDIVELTGKEDVMIRNLSGGQRKRASIAVELIADHKLFSWMNLLVDLILELREVLCKHFGRWLIVGKLLY